MSNDNVINLADIKKMQETLDNADVPHDEREPRMILYRDLEGFMQVLVEGEVIKPEQWDLVPDEVKQMVQTDLD